MIVTIKDVAARAGVSAKTVSRVMNGEPHVRAAIRETVMRVVDELGYRPNAFARSLSSARSYLLGLFFDDPSSGYATAMQGGASQRCRERDYHLVVEPLDLASPRWADELVATVRALRLDGAILTPPLSQHPELLDRLDALGLPYVRISPNGHGDARSGSVDIDEERAAFDMTRHLLDLGHRDIAFVEGNPEHAGTANRRAGFVAAMAAAGLSPSADRILRGNFSFRSGIEAGEALFGQGATPSAVFASNDDMALGLLVAAMKRGLPVPETVSIAGFDDAPTARLAWPQITTIRQPVAEMGAAAVDILVSPGYRAAAGDPDYRRRLDYALIERGSTARHYAG